MDYQTGKSTHPAPNRLSSPSHKNILIFRNCKSVNIRGYPASQEGRFAVVTSVIRFHGLAVAAERPIATNATVRRSAARNKNERSAKRNG
jgi:hypothetical protein